MQIGDQENLLNPFLMTQAPSIRNELLIFFVLGGLGTVASYLSVNIPHTNVYVEGRWAFGFMGFALLRRWWMAMLLACLLSVTGPHSLPLSICFLGNMLYALPALAAIHLIHFHLLSRASSLALYGIGWFLLVMICYQTFNTPLIWAVSAMLRDTSVWPAVLTGWQEQPFLMESLLVGTVSTSGMMVLRSHESFRQRRRDISITLDSIGDGVIATDVRARVIRMNPVAQALTGWPLEEARGKPIDEIFPIISAKTDQPVENPVVRVLREPGIVGLDHHACLIARDGTSRQIADSVSPLREPDGRLIGAVMVFRDVTKEYEAEQKLHESRQQLEAALRELEKNLLSLRQAEDIAKLGYFERNWQTGEGYWSDGFCKLLGLQPGTIQKHEQFMRYIHDDDRERVADHIRTSLASGEGMDVYFQIIREDGLALTIHAKGNTTYDDQGRPLSIRGTFQDITERTQAEEKLIRYHRLFEAVIRQAPFAAHVLEGDFSNAHFLIENDESRRLMGESVEGRDIDLDESEMLQCRFFTPDGKREVPLPEMPSPRAIQGEIVKNEEYLFRHADGGEYYIIANASPIRNDDGEIVAVVVTFHDISDHKKLEMQFQQAQRLESVGRLAGGVAHDLNNLLSPILGYGEMLLHDLDEDEAHRASVENMVRAGWRARDIVRQLLAFSRKQVLAFKPVDLNAVLSGFEKLLRRTIREDIVISITSAASLPFIRGDIGQLEQVIMNLMVNAQDAMPDGGRLIIETSVTELDKNESALHDEVEPGVYVMLNISDTGCGMDAETLEHLFEPFFTTKPKDKGTGLGLATAHGIVRQHSGSIRVYSELGQGTSFRIYLPVSGESSEPEAVISEESVKSDGSETILLAEDNEQVREMTNEILTWQGYKVLIAENGRDALAALDQHDGPVHLLLTDVIMPDMNGRELFERIAVQDPAMKVIFMSGYTDNVITHHGVMEPGVNFIQKPFSIKALTAKVREVLDQHPGKPVT